MNTEIMLSSKLIQVDDTLLWHWCPGCSQVHGIYLTKHQWNGDAQRPTFTPDFAVLGSCFYYINCGFICFYRNSTHWLSNRGVILPDFPEKWR